MNYNKLINELRIDKKQLDIKKQQTDYKIKYIVEYVRLWIKVNVNRKNITDLNFVDCMCNAGIYQDGDLCTSIEVLLLFLDEAAIHTDKHFNLFINDYDPNRLDICKRIADIFLDNKKLNNITVFTDVSDVNDYLMQYSFFDKYFGYGKSTIVFVDPYDFGTVVIERLVKLVSKYYCELIFNLFTSDYVRNGIDDRISRCIRNTMISNKEELVSYIGNCLKAGYIKHVFSYQFRTSTNTELYQIIYATPHIKGLQVLKEALWKTFNGKFYHRNYTENSGQMCLFSNADERQVLLGIHAGIAKEKLFKALSGLTVSFTEIEYFLMENTMIQEGDIIRSVLKPLIAEGSVSKIGMQNKSNYKNDEYIFIKEKGYENDHPKDNVIQDWSGIW